MARIETDFNLIEKIGPSFFKRMNSFVVKKWLENAHALFFITVLQVSKEVTENT